MAKKVRDAASDEKKIQRQASRLRQIKGQMKKLKNRVKKLRDALNVALNAK